MSYRTPDGRFRKPKEVFPKITDVIKNYEFWNKRRIIYLGDDKFFDQEVRTGVCYFCKIEGRAQKSKITNLHHLKYDHLDYLAWTIEVCKSCHWQIDENNRKVIANRTGKEIGRRYGKYNRPYYENSVEKMKREEREREDWYKSFCWNIGGKFEPNEKLIPNRETYDKVIEAIKNADSKRNTMSNVSRRYF